MTKAIVLSRKNAQLHASKFNDRVLISIESPKHTYESDPIDYYSNDILKVRFDDILDSLDGAITMSPLQATEIHQFIQSHLEDDFVIHCDAGMSRSTAVGSFMEQFYDYDLTYVASGDDKFRNIHVFNLLRRDLYNDNYSLHE